MNCREFRKFVGAFADGELDTELNVKTLEHLNMCPECTKRVAEVQQIKHAVSRVYGQEKAPAGLANRVRSSIGVGKRRQPMMARAFHVLLIPVSIAAAALAAVQVWDFVRSDRPAEDAGEDTAPQVQVQFALDARQRHSLCCDVGHGHDNPIFSKDVATAGDRLTEKLKLKVFAPDLGEFGFQFVGGDVCGIGERPGAHLIYRSDSGRMLSVFSVALPSRSGLDMNGYTGSTCQDFKSDQPLGLSIAGWNEGCAAYVFCGQVERGKLVEMSIVARGASYCEDPQ